MKPNQKKLSGCLEHSISNCITLYVFHLAIPKPRVGCGQVSAVLTGKTQTQNQLNKNSLHHFGPVPPFC